MGGVRVLVGTRKGAFVLTSDERTAGLGGRRAALRGLGELPPQGLAGGPRPGLGGAVRGLVRAADPALRRRRARPGSRSATTFALRRRARHPPVVRRHAAPVGVRPGVAPRAVAHRPRHRLRRRRGRRAVQDHRRRRRPGPSSSGLREHGSGSHWQPGAGGMCLHTILLDPTDEQRMYTAISAAGAFRTDDGGTTWTADQQGPAVRRHPRPGRRGRPLRPQPRDAPVAARGAVHAEALGRHAQRRRRRLLARDQRRPADRLRLPDRRARPRAGDGLRRADPVGLRSTSRRTAGCASTAAAPAAASGSR